MKYALQQHFGKSGAYFHGVASGIDHRPVRADPIRKSVGAESTFSQDLDAYEPLRDALQPIMDKVWRHCDATGVRGRTVTLKTKFSDFSQITRSRSEPTGIGDRVALEAASLELLGAEMPVRRSVRLLGISLSNLEVDLPHRPQMRFDV